MEFLINDSTSFANLQNFTIEHSHFDWKLDFNNHRLHGFVVHSVRRVNTDSDFLILDVKNLNVRQVFVENCDTQFQYTDGDLGGKLIVPIKDAQNKFQVKIHYSTTTSCEALQWLSPEMTSGGRHPFMYSQCEAIHARSLFPCQDSPAVKATYTATIDAPSCLEVLMSAIKEMSFVVDERKIHRFSQKIPIPSYLVAISSGNIVGRQIGPRSTLWSEPEIADKAQWEFMEVDKILSLTEQMTTDYEWGVCDLLILPPVFPYGGMENPCLIFLTSCLLTGDRSQIHYVVHEIAHSWTGNLVTNRNWDHFWINEGHANYLERLILEKMHNNSSEYRHFQILLGLAHLEESISTLTQSDRPRPEFTKLVPNLSGTNPDDSFSTVPYEKGSFFLFYLEGIFGKDKMLRWLKSYIKTYRLKSLTTEEWKSFFKHYMTLVEGIHFTEFDKIDWDSWFYSPGNMPVDPRSLINPSMTVPCVELVEMWKIFDHSKLYKSDLLSAFRALISDQKYYFFNLLNDIEKIILSEPTLEVMGELYELTTTCNSQLLYGWSILCLRSHYTPAIDQIFRFLNSQGRLIYNKPIYMYLLDWPVTAEKAKLNFAEQNHRMHHVTREEDFDEDVNEYEIIESNNAELSRTINSGFYDGQCSEEARPKDNSKYWDGFRLSYDEVSEAAVLEGEIVCLKRLWREIGGDQSVNERLEQLHQRACGLQQYLGDILCQSTDSVTSMTRLSTSSYPGQLIQLKSDTTELIQSMNIDH